MTTKLELGKMGLEPMNAAEMQEVNGGDKKSTVVKVIKVAVAILGVLISIFG